MSAFTKDGKLRRPFTGNSFQEKINQFYEIMNSITLQDMEATAEERRQIIAGALITVFSSV